jgi:hypothetical protein
MVSVWAIVFGLKGRFCQPRPQAWGTVECDSTLKGSFERERPLQGRAFLGPVTQAVGLG